MTCRGPCVGARCTRLRCIRGRVRGLIGWKRAAVASSRSMASPLSPKSLPWALRNLTSSLPLETQHALGARMQFVRAGSSGSHPPPAPQHYRSAQYARRRALGGFGKEMAYFNSASTVEGLSDLVALAAWGWESKGLRGFRGTKGLRG